MVLFIEFDFLDFNNNMVLSSKKSNRTMLLSPKLAIFDDSPMVLFDFFDDSSTVLLKFKNPSW